MALPHFITQTEKNWLLKVTKETSKQPTRDLNLLVFFMATPCVVLEINRIQIGDVITKSGSIVKNFTIRGEKSFNGQDRIISMKNSILRNLTSDYLVHRANNKIGMGNHPDHYLGLDPIEPLFFTNKGSGFSIVKKLTGAGNITYSADALARHLKQLMNKDVS